MGEHTTTYRGVGFSSLLTIAFIVLKLTGVISWTWFWVLSPTIFSFSIGVVLLIIWIILYKTT